MKLGCSRGITPTIIKSKCSCKLSYGDFVVWSKNGILVERITRDDEIFSGHMDDVKHFFIYAILQEIVGKWYSRKPVADADGLVQIPTTSNEQ